MINNKLEKAEYIYSLFQDTKDAYMGKHRYILEFSSNDKYREVKDRLESYGIKLLEETENSFQVILDKDSIDFDCYYNNYYFLKDFTGAFQNDILILKSNNSFLFYAKENNCSYDIKGLSPNYLVCNTVLYNELLKKLKSNTFADYVNTASTEIVFYTSTKGVFKLKYPLVSPQLDVFKDYSASINAFLNKLEINDFIFFIKNEIFDYIKSPAQEQMLQFIDHLPQILESAQRNYEINKKNFSFEAVKSRLQTEKEKYFNSLREILGKVLSQLVGIPVSISASIFASYKVDNQIVVIMILFAFLIYACFMISLLSIYLVDTDDIEKTFNKEFGIILEQSGLNEFEVNNEKKIVKNRIHTIKQIIALLGTATIILSILLYIITGIQLLKSYTYTFAFIGVMIIFCIYIVIYYKDYFQEDSF